MNSRKGAVVFLSWLSVLLWMAFIFLLSAQAGDESASLSGGFVDILGAFVRIIIPNIGDDALHLLVRKLAHMGEYSVLVILLVNALRQHFYRKHVIYTYAVSISLLYAVSDEVHQVFVPARAGSVIDVLIDALGVLIGVLLFELFVQVFKPGNDNL